MKNELYLSYPEAHFWADFSFVDFPEDYWISMKAPIEDALRTNEGTWKEAQSLIPMRTEWSDIIG